LKFISYFEIRSKVKIRSIFIFYETVYKLITVFILKKKKSSLFLKPRHWTFKHAWKRTLYVLAFLLCAETVTHGNSHVHTERKKSNCWQAFPSLTILTGQAHEATWVCGVEFTPIRLEYRSSHGDCCASLKAARTETPTARAGGQLGRGTGTIFFFFCWYFFSVFILPFKIWKKNLISAKF
jgi:hypothetical protein